MLTNETLTAHAVGELIEQFMALIPRAAGADCATTARIGVMIDALFALRALHARLVAGEEIWDHEGKGKGG